MSTTHNINHYQHHDYHTTDRPRWPVVREECWAEVSRDGSLQKKTSAWLLDRIDYHSVHINFDNIDNKSIADLHDALALISVWLCDAAHSKTYSI